MSYFRGVFFLVSSIVVAYALPHENDDSTLDEVNTAVTQRSDIFSRGHARKGFDIVMKRLTEAHKKMDKNVQQIPHIVKKSLVDYERETQTSMAMNYLKQNAGIFITESIEKFDSSKEDNSFSISDSFHPDISHSIDIEVSNNYDSSSCDYYSDSYSLSSDYEVDHSHSLEINAGFVDSGSHSLSIDYGVGSFSSFSSDVSDSTYVNDNDE